MSRGQPASYAESGFGRSSWGSTWWERRQKRHEDREHEEEGKFGLREGSFQTYWTMSGASGHNCFDKRDRDEELERLQRLVRDLELQARGRRQRKDHRERRERLASVEDHHGARSHQSGSHNTRIAHRNMQTRTRFPRRRGDLRMWPWTL